MYSRVRASGLANGIPYQPSTTCGPDTPRPRMKRPPERMVHRHRRHRRRGRLARRHLHDRRAELQALGRCAPPRQRREAVRAVGLGRPDRVEAEPLGLGDRLDDPGRRSAGPVAGVQSQLQLTRHARGTIVVGSRARRDHGCNRWGAQRHAPAHAGGHLRHVRAVVRDVDDERQALRDFYARCGVRPRRARARSRALLAQTALPEEIEALGQLLDAFAAQDIAGSAARTRAPRSCTRSPRRARRPSSACASCAR